MNTKAAALFTLIVVFGLISPAAGDQSTTGSQSARAGAVLWREPADIESRDLFYGPGGAGGAPDVAGKFTFIKRDGSPSDTSEKIVVRDQKGRRWTVKLGPEAGPETTASRIVWAAGYHTDQDYFVKSAEVEGRGGFRVRDARFERDDDGFKKVSNWDWASNPFVGTRELEGLKALMALLNNWDLSPRNNKVVRPNDDASGSQTIYYVNDLGASLGTTGSPINRLPVYADVAVPGSRGDAEAFASHPFIDGVAGGEVRFHWRRSFGRKALKGVKVESARWMGDLLARLSDKQLSDAFRAGGFSEADTAIYVKALRSRIRQLQGLR